MTKSVFVRETDDARIITPPVCEVEMVSNGLQFRYQLPTGGKLSICEAPQKGRAERKGHHHMGLTEVYVIHFGVIKIFFIDDVGKYTHVTLEPHKRLVLRVKALVNHGVLQGPSAVFTVQTVGTPVSNPLCNNNDWYPADDIFNERLDLFFKKRGY